MPKQGQHGTFKGKKKFVPFKGFMVPAWTHGFKASIGFKKDAVSPEKSLNKCQKLAF